MKLRRCLASVLLLAGAQHALAAGTTQGTSVANTATVDYSVGGVNQTDVNSNTATFLVDRRIDLTVAEVGGTSTSVIPGAVNQVTTFTVTNTTNGIQDFRLVASNDANGPGTAFDDHDNFDPTNVRVFVESGVTVGYQAAEDTAIFIDELAADTTRTVYVLADIPVNRSNGNTAGVTLRAFAADSGTGGTLGADATQTAGADTAGVDTVFGDAAGEATTSGDAARDGSHSDDDEYDVVTAELDVTKSSVIISDPFNGTTNPKAIPGAVIEYCLDIENSGALPADAIVLSDLVPANTTFVAASIRSLATGAGTGCTSGTGASEDDDAAGADETDPNGGDFTAGAVNVRTASIAAGARFKALFRVTIN